MKLPAQNAMEQFLDTLGIRFETIDRQGKWSLQQTWRQRFSRRVKDATGKWSSESPDWSTFSAGYTASVRGFRAESAYADAVAKTVILLSSNPAIPSYRCSSKPNLVDLRQLLIHERRLYDLYVFPPDFGWTMVFVHEEEMGPFFSTSSS
jgi:hypothetical protein